jgi:capsular exopolysaccharide synthesis family protein
MDKSNDLPLSFLPESSGAMEIKKYLFPLRKWWWLLVASTLVATVSSSLAVLRQPKIYQARTTLMIGTTIKNPNPSNNDFLLSQQLAASYADIANREIVAMATMNALDIDQMPAYAARALPNSHLIEIVVTDIDLERAKKVADELAEQLILLSPASTQPEEEVHQEFINEQLKNLEIQITETEDEIEILQKELGNLISAQEIEDTQNQLTALQSKLTTLQNTYGTLLTNTNQGAVNTLTILEPAALSATPIASKKALTVVLAAILGLVLAACEAYLLEYLDGTVKTADEVASLFSTPIIGHIFEQEKGGNDNNLYDPSSLHNPVAESFRALRAQIEFADEEQPLRTILISSADIGDGKTSVAANLSLFIAQKKKRVVLLDADWRKPNIHKVFNLPNNQGLGDALMEQASLKDLIAFVKDARIAVLTSGTTPPNPTELISSKNFDQLLAKLGRVADVVIIDGPPFIVSDAMVLASKVDGVLLVTRPGHTRRSLARSTMAKIKQTHARLVGVILNRIPLNGADYYAGQSSLDSYYLSSYGIEGEEIEKSNGNKHLRENILVNVYKFRGSFKQRFKTIFKPSPK